MATNHVLLVGAGFSANWGAPLAADVTGSLLQDLHDDPVLERALRNGPFEQAFATFQSQPSNAEHAAKLQRFQDSIVALFARINASLIPQRFEWQDNGMLVASRSVKDFLGRFDAIFSLNQDLLLEICYAPYLILGRRWDSVVFPGMTGRYPPGVDPIAGPLKQIWTPNGDLRVGARSQPIYKLHGSSNWLDDSGKPVLIIGGGKQILIDRSPLLKEYHSQFAARLAQPDTKLMVIGYSFQDEHINDVIEHASRHGLGTYIVDPQGRGVLLDPAYARAAIRPQRDIEKIKIIGETRQPLKDFMGRDTFPYQEMMRFFS